MGLETGSQISDLVITNPLGSDAKSTADDHLRLIKTCVKGSFPNISGAVTPTHTELNYVDGVTSAIQTQLDAKGAVAGQTWTGTHTFPATTYGVTATLGDSSTKFATTAFVAGTAFSSALPAQTGNADKFLTTDGATASFSANLKAGTIRFVDSTDTTKVLAFSLSGITTGTTRTVTLPDKSGTLAMTSDSALVLLATLTPTAAANVDFLTTFTSSYDNYLILGTGLVPASAEQLFVRLAVAGVADAGANYYKPVLNSTTTTANNEHFIGGNVRSGGLSFSIRVSNVNSTIDKSIFSESTYHSGVTPDYNSHCAGTAYINTGTVTGCRFLWGGGVLFNAVGKIRVYGYQNS